MFGCIQDTLVVVVDNLFSVIHATVADLDGIALDDFSEFVLLFELARFPRSRHIQFRYIASFRNVLVTSVIC